MTQTTILLYYEMFGDRFLRPLLSNSASLVLFVPIHFNTDPEKG